MDTSRQELAITFQEDRLLALILDSSHALLMVVDETRRIVYGSQGILELSGITDLSDMIGRRPGDLFRCANAEESGCGESSMCRHCDVFNGICQSLEGTVVEQECSLTLRQDGRVLAQDFLVRTTPLLFGGSKYVVISFQDISHKKRRRALEQVFLHDILNSVGAVRGILNFLASDLQGEQQALLVSILPYFDICVDEIAAQRKLLAAENNELVLNTERFSVVQMLTGLADIYSQHALGNGKKIEVDVEAGLDEIVGDRVIMRRIMSNLLKNALEASSAGDRIRLTASMRDSKHLFTVHNPGVIHPEVQSQLFRRSFSTKGEGRGLGAYSIKLLCTNYLNGTVWFESSEESGTEFFVSIPIDPGIQR